MISRDRECSLFFSSSFSPVVRRWCVVRRRASRPREGAEGGGGGSDGVGRGREGEGGGDGGGEERRSDTRRVRKRSVHILARDIPATIPGVRSGLSLFSPFLSLFPPSFSLSFVCFSPPPHLAPLVSLAPSLFGVSARSREIYARASEMIIYKA